MQNYKRTPTYYKLIHQNNPSTFGYEYPQYEIEKRNYCFRSFGYCNSFNFSFLNYGNLGDFVRPLMSLSCGNNLKLQFRLEYG